MPGQVAALCAELMQCVSKPFALVWVQWRTGLQRRNDGVAKSNAVVIREVFRWNQEVPEGIPCHRSRHGESATDRKGLVAPDLHRLCAELARGTDGHAQCLDAVDAASAARFVKLSVAAGIAEHGHVGRAH